MKVQNLLSTALILASTQAMAHNHGSKDAMKGASDAKGKCYGIVGKEEGECGGRNPATGDTWSCAGQNPTADLGWKSTTRAECDSASQHKDATKKYFKANKA
ncbi:MAG: hypothetical protein AB8E15_00845 [Bdellovibrionales bacterium]